jgi:acylphosphatase
LKRIESLFLIKTGRDTKIIFKKFKKKEPFTQGISVTLTLAGNGSVQVSVVSTSIDLKDLERAITVSRWWEKTKLLELME